MLTPPTEVTDAEVLAVVRARWSGHAESIDGVQHLPVGFGAHHWQAGERGLARFFLTWDRLGRRHDAQSLEAAYAGAGQLAFKLDAVVAGLLTDEATYTVPLNGGALSVTPWVWGERAGDGPPASREDAEATARSLGRLHAATPPRGLRSWAPSVPQDLAERLAQSLRSTWRAGPLAQEAQSLLREHLGRLPAWTRRHRELVAVAPDRPWVATHGEPHSRNQIRSLTGRLLLVDWESLLRAPAERDLRTLVDAGHGDLVDDADPGMLELFDLDWRLDEVAQYAARFARPHGDGADDREALAALRHELTRP